MIRRHPHVFGAEETRTADQQVAAWEVQKAAERAARAETGTLAGIPIGLPALTRAAKLTRRAGRVGFDWPDAAAVLDKLEEEAAELRAELRRRHASRLILQHCATRSATCSSCWPTSPASSTSTRRTACAGPTESSSDASALSNNHFDLEGKSPADSSLDEMESLWSEAKRIERQET